MKHIVAAMLALALISEPALAQVISGAITTAVTVTNASAQAVPSRSRFYLGIINESASATIACNLGGTASVNGAGSITIAPGGAFTFDAGKIPTDSVNCISSVASSPATVIE